MVTKLYKARDYNRDFTVIVGNISSDNGGDNDDNENVSLKNEFPIFKLFRGYPNSFNLIITIFKTRKPSHNGGGFQRSPGKPLCVMRNLYIAPELFRGDGVQAHKEEGKFPFISSRSPEYFEFGHSKLLLCRGRQRNVRKCITHVHWDITKPQRQ